MGKLRMNDLIQQGFDKKLFSLNDEETKITYNTGQKQGATKPWNETEEKVRAYMVAKLVIEHQYPIYSLGIEVKVPMGADTKRADIIAYKVKNGKKTNQAYMIVEVKDKKQKDLKTAKDQAISYAHATGAEYAVATNGSEFWKVHIGDNENRKIDDFPDFGGSVPKWKYKRNSVDNDIKPLNTEKLKSILKEIHDYLWNGGKRNPAEAFNEFSKIVFTKIMDEKVDELSEDYTEYYEFQKDRDETKEQREIRIKNLYDKHKKKDSNVFDDTLILEADEITFLVEKLEAYSLNETELDIKGKIFQDFFAKFFKGDAGQYFTPPNVVKFIVDLFDLKENDRVIDPSCGSGGFLLQSLAQMQNKSKEFLKKKENPTDKDKERAKAFWHNFAEKKLYGIEISGGISRTAKMNMIIHDDGHTNVITSDGLATFDSFQKQNNEFIKESFDYIFTNPPFGSTIKDDKTYFSTFDNFANSHVDFIDKIIDNKYRKDLKQQKSEILFLERYYQLLKPSSGIVAMVLPDGILTNSTMQHVRNYLIERFKLLASFSLPQHTFSNYGAGVKSSILVLKKKSKVEVKKFLDKQDSVREIHTNKHRHEILAVRKELKEKVTPYNQKIKELKKEVILNEELIEEFQEKVVELKEEYKLKEEIVRDKIYEAVNTEMSKFDKYPIFMSIIDEIGYDSKGNNTCKYEESELFTVGNEFKTFYEEVYKKGNVNFT